MLSNSRTSDATEAPSHSISRFLGGHSSPIGRQPNEVAQEEQIPDLVVPSRENFHPNAAEQYREVHPSGNYPTFNAHDGGNNPIQPDVQPPTGNYYTMAAAYNMQPAPPMSAASSQNPQQQMSFAPAQMYYHQPMPNQHNMVYTTPGSAVDPNSSFTSSNGDPGTPQMSHMPPQFRDPTLTSMCEDQKPNNLSLTVQKHELWEQFNSHGNEMILTKKGRKMFPNIMIRITGFDRKEHYRVGLRFERIDENRYKYSDYKWTAIGKGDPDTGDVPMIWHRDDMASGDTWNKQEPIKFDKVKLTNTNHNIREQIVSLRSMHKYIPVVYIVRMESDDIDNGPTHLRRQYLAAKFPLHVMEFIAVTAYNNEQLKSLKVDNNKYAKGFRVDGKHTTKRHSTDSAYGTPQTKMRRESPTTTQPQYVQMPMQVTQAMPAQYQTAMGGYQLVPMNGHGLPGHMYAPSMQMAAAQPMYGGYNPYTPFPGFQMQVPPYGQQLIAPAHNQSHVQGLGQWQPNAQQQQQEAESDSESPADLEQHGS